MGRLLLSRGLSISVTLLSSLLLLTPPSAVCQSAVTGAVSGTVEDPTGLVVAGATVKITEKLTGISETTTTKMTGAFSFPFLKPGAYVITVSQRGFSITRQNVDIRLGQTSEVTIKLRMGETSETVEVTTERQLISPSDVNLTTSVPSLEVANLPSPGNDLTNFAQTAPGIAMNTAGGYGNFTAFGLPSVSNLFTINGSDYNDPFLNVNNSGASNLLLGANEVQEVAVITNAYTGQYGRQAGAQVDYATKSGTNSLHGDASYYWTGRAMDANDWFNNFNNVPRPFQNNNQWAAALGGPIMKNRIFFFANTEGIRYVFGTSTQVFLPASLFESEVLATLPVAAQPFYQNIFKLYNAAPGADRAQPAPDSCSGYVPVNPAIGTNCLVTYRDTTTNGNREWIFSLRGDVVLGNNDKLFARWKTDHGYQPTYTDPINPIFNAGSNQPTNEGQLNYTHVFSSTLVNNFVGSILYESFIFGSPDMAKALAVFPYILSPIGSSLTPLGSGSGSYATYPQGRNVTQWQLVDDLSWARDHHSLRFGVNVRRDDATSYAAAGQPFPQVYASLGDFAAGVADLVHQNFALNSGQPLAYYSLGLYGQDEWAIKPKLKLTFALRVDRNSAGACQTGCTSLSRQPFNSPTFSHSPDIAYDQMMVSSTKILRSIEPAVLQPRIGFAYSGWGSDTVVRGGVGLFSDLYPLSLLNSFTLNFPSVNQFYVPGPFPLSPDVPGSAAFSVAACNGAFTSNFRSGGTVTSYLSANPNCGLPYLLDVAQEYKTPKFLKWNLEVQHSFGSSTALSLDYVGNYGYNILVPLPDLNAFGFADLPANAPDTRVTFVGQYASTGHSNYNGLTISLNQSVWKGFTGRLNWTWSHAADDLSNGGYLNYGSNSLFGQIQPYCLRCLNHASADYDLRQYLSASYVWNLPLHSANTFLSHLADGWTISQTLYRRTGYPFSILDGVTSSNLIGANNAIGVILAYPSGSGALPAHCGAPTVSGGVITPCFTPDLFLPAGTSPGFGGTARNSVRGPGYFNTDLTVRKSFKLTERVQFSVAAIFYNVLNHPNFANPISNLANSSLFGSVSQTVSPPTTPYGTGAGAAEDARIVQLNGKITF